MNRYKQSILKYSEALIELTKPILVLDSIKWRGDIFETFRKSKFREMPKIHPDYFNQHPLKFNPENKITELQELGEKIARHFGPSDPINIILSRQVKEYITAVKLLKNRGKKSFYKYSCRLYGSTSSHFLDNKSSVSLLGETMYQVLKNLVMATEHEPRNIEAHKAVKILSNRLKSYFHGDDVHVKLSDGIVSDAAAGSNYIKFKKGAYYSERDLSIYEVHEGHVHVGTSLNGKAQPYAKWLSVGSPAVATTQEGLALFMEVVSLLCTPYRLKKVNDRIKAIKMAEDGANFIDVFDFFRDQGCDEWEGYKRAHRVFRGTTGQGGVPFTKDLAYEKGFIQIFNFLSVCVSQGRPELIPFLFTGKLIIKDIPLIYELYERDIVTFPKYLPEPFRDIKGMTTWLSFSKFLNTLDLNRIEKQLKKVIKLGA